MENKFLEYCRITNQNLTQALDALKVVDVELQISNIDIRMKQLEIEMSQLRSETNQLGRLIDSNQKINNTKFVETDTKISNQNTRILEIEEFMTNFSTSTTNRLDSLEFRIRKLEMSEQVDVSDLEKQIKTISNKIELPAKDVWYIIFDDTNLTAQVKAIRFASNVEFFSIGDRHTLWNIDVMTSRGGVQYQPAKSVVFSKIGDPSRNCLKAVVTGPDYTNTYYIAL